MAAVRCSDTRYLPILLLLMGLLCLGADRAHAQTASTNRAETSAVPSTTGDGHAAPLDLPVSIERIKEQLAHAPAHPLKGLDDKPMFAVEVQERSHLEELVASLDFRSGPVPAGGLLANEMQRVWFPSVDNPLRQPYAAFNQGELLTVLVQNLVGKYLIGRAIESITAADRVRAENAAKAEVRQAVAEYCTAQPNQQSIAICTTPTP